MKQLEEIHLTDTEHQALTDLTTQLRHSFDVEQVILYGSVVRNEADEESDIDLLILTTRPYLRPERHEITDLVFEINLKYDTNFSTLVVDQLAWDTGPVSILPIHDSVLKEGIAV